MRVLFATCVLVVLGLQGSAHGKGMGPDFYKVQRTAGKPRAPEGDPQATGSVQRPQRVCGKKARKTC